MTNRENNNRYNIKYNIWWKSVDNYTIPSGRLHLMVYDRQLDRIAYAESLK